MSELNKTKPLASYFGVVWFNGEASDIVVATKKEYDSWKYEIARTTDLYPSCKPMPLIAMEKITPSSFNTTLAGDNCWLLARWMELSKTYSFCKGVTEALKSAPFNEFVSLMGHRGTQEVIREYSSKMYTWFDNVWEAFLDVQCAGPILDTCKSLGRTYKRPMDLIYKLSKMPLDVVYTSATVNIMALSHFIGTSKIAEGQVFGESKDKSILKCKRLKEVEKIIAEMRKGLRDATCESGDIVEELRADWKATQDNI